MYKNILLPVDGSEESSDILHHTSEIARQMDATIHVLFVADTTRDSVTVVENTVVDALVQEGEDIVADAGETLATLGAEYETDVVQGSPAPTIVEYAKRYDHDLVVMSTHGREGLSRYLRGSVSEKVVRLSSVPVLTARMQPDEQLVFPYENILIPTDGSAGATYAAQQGLALAESLDATVHALSVVEESSLRLDVRSAMSGDELEEAATAAVDDIVADATARGLDAIGHVERGSPADIILDSIQPNEIHAIVMGTTGRSGIDRILLGSVAEQTVRTAPVPAITVARET
ncbi:MULTISPECIES: universal stress protein [Haloferacaceae]|uniref:Universal stress protein n=1 Tax=Haloplanus rubicundus TaxID=1547898 RepID=A0A345E883_9EURY|nr:MULTISPECIES: universal stress protein [Haloferacaceae]AXG08405.1 universal stress protein [Haloplanus rubicundus]MDQ2056374.1 universal stress protein [Halobellus sp. H-GB7]